MHKNEINASGMGSQNQQKKPSRNIQFCTSLVEIIQTGIFVAIQLQLYNRQVQQQAGFHTGFSSGGVGTFSELQISPASHPQKVCTTTCKATALILKLVGFDSFHVVT